MSESRAGGAEADAGAKLAGAARQVIRGWALLGGLILVGLVLMTAAGALSNLFFNRPFPGDYELVKHGVAIAAFAFLPYAQLTHANVTVGLFTEGAGPRFKSAAALLASLIAILVAGVLFRQMWLGMLDYIEYREAMMALPIQLWTAFPPALVSLALLMVAGVITAAEALGAMRRVNGPPT
jgi:TRAP-type C4-dicarboxylate transport system permease small subunit